MGNLLEITEKYFATSEEQAEKLLNKLKDENVGNVKKSSIDKRIKKETEFFIISITVKHEDEKELFDNM